MKIYREELQQQREELQQQREELQQQREELPIELFYARCKSPATKKKYTRTLQKILCDVLEDILEGSFEQRTNQLVSYAQENPKWIQGVLLQLSEKLRKRTELSSNHVDYLNPISVNNYFKPLRKLLDMNDIPVSWKRIYSTFPELDNVSDSRGYTLQEIQKMLQHANGQRFCKTCDVYFVTDSFRCLCCNQVLRQSKRYHKCIVS